MRLYKDTHQLIMKRFFLNFLIEIISKTKKQSWTIMLMFLYHPSAFVPFMAHTLVNEIFFRI